MPQAAEATRFPQVWIRPERKAMKPLCLRLLPVKPFLNVTEGVIIAPFMM